VTGKLIKLKNGEIPKFYSPPNIGDLKGIRHAWQKMYTKFSSGYLKGRDQLEEPRVKGRIILKWILEIHWDGVD
jgi:hypothetical protein